ncbi:hypothetical protein ACFWRG_08970 [Micromonospora tulbaghiae]|uniref:hypothetical protein n=1 Tax=Micromonospora tulbaghiae TaxID=479978 RepID=UPI0036647FB3
MPLAHPGTQVVAGDDVEVSASVGHVYEDVEVDGHRRHPVDVRDPPPSLRGDLHSSRPTVDLHEGLRTLQARGMTVQQSLGNRKVPSSLVFLTVTRSYLFSFRVERGSDTTTAASPRRSHLEAAC